MIVTSRPSTDYTVVFSKGNKLPTEFCELYHYRRGCDALLAALMALEIIKGDKIGVPAYVCSSVVEALKQAGYNLVFIDVEFDLTLDLVRVVDLAEREGFKVLLVIHYFGLPVEIEDLVKDLHRRNVLILEDCCHSFLSHIYSGKVNIIGDAAIFSMRKTLPVSDGGALYLKSKASKNRVSEKVSGLEPISWPYLLRNIFENIVTFIGWPNVYSSWVSEIKKYVRKRSNASSSINKNNITTTPQKASRLLNRYMSHNSYLQQVRERTRKNYLSLGSGALSIGLQPYSTELPEGCVPQWLPVYDLSLEALELMRQHGVGASHWPWEELPDEVAMDYSQYPVANHLNSSLVLLPVHHEIGNVQIARMLELLKQLKNINASNINWKSKS